MNDGSLKIGDRISWREARGGMSFANFTPDRRRSIRLSEPNRMLVQQEGVELPRLIQEIQGSWFAYRGQDIFDLPIMKAPE